MEEKKPRESSQSTQSSELEALSAVVKALHPFPPDVQRRIIDSALTFLGGAGLQQGGAITAREPRISGVGSRELGVQVRPRVRDIRQLREEKQPRTAIEMAVLVAYHLSEEADPALRKDKISDADIEKYFKQGGFKLPRHPGMTLVHAKNAGYFDALGEGHYKLNPVGSNLVTHGLPRRLKEEGGGARVGSKKRSASSAARRKKLAKRRGLKAKRA